MIDDIVRFLMHRFWAEVGEIAVFLVCGYALIAGTWRERFGGAIYLVAYVIPWVFAAISIRSVGLYFLAADVLLLPGFFTINRNSPQPWTRWALGSQVLSVALDIARLIYDSGRFDPFYIIVQAILGYVVLIALLTGTIAAHRLNHRKNVTTGGT
ncbi:hypothetical protein [Asticcacaulis solisilvae]|uniref:hypothetical protein n=1 Tax=Asticcacaulis solisilvae TaxID=1217274 RepID=UPI003FD741C4